MRRASPSSTHFINIPCVTQLHSFPHSHFNLVYIYVGLRDLQLFISGYARWASYRSAYTECVWVILSQNDENAPFCKFVQSPELSGIRNLIAFVNSRKQAGIVFWHNIWYFSSTSWTPLTYLPDYAQSQSILHSYMDGALSGVDKSIISSTPTHVTQISRYRVAANSIIW